MMKKNSNVSYVGDTRTKVSTILGKGTVFDGNLSAPESTQIDGTLNGNCDCKAQLIIGGDGYVKGDINAHNVLISGRVEGNVVAGKKVEVLSTGKVVGNITAKALVIDEGACFDGQCIMSTATISSATPTTINSSDAPSNTGSGSGNEGSGEPFDPDKSDKKKKW